VQDRIAPDKIEVVYDPKNTGEGDSKIKDIKAENKKIITATQGYKTTYGLIANITNNGKKEKV
jgi:hypothetical protein